MPRTPHAVPPRARSWIRCQTTSRVTGSSVNADAFVAARIADGADHLKIFIEDGTAIGTPMPVLSPETIRALVRAAHERGLRTAAHTLTRRSARLVIDCGVDGLAHAPADGLSDDALA